MTSPVTPPAAPVVPLYPPLGSASFNADAYAYGTAMPSVVDGISDLAENAYTNALSASEDATAAQASAISAASAASAALAASNFKGEWATLTGALNKPACVKHSGRFWLLLNNLANVATSQPGVSADWTALDGGTVVQRVTGAGTVNMVVGVTYAVAVAGVTLVAPATLQTGDTLIARAEYNGTFLVNWTGNTVKGDTQSTPMTIPAYRGFEVTYTGSTLA